MSLIALSLRLLPSLAHSGSGDLTRTFYNWIVDQIAGAFLSDPCRFHIHIVTKAAGKLLSTSIIGKIMNMLTGMTDAKIKTLLRDGNLQIGW